MASASHAFGKGDELFPLSVAGHRRDTNGGLDLERFAHDEVALDVLAGWDSHACARPGATLEKAFELDPVEGLGDGQQAGPHLGGDRPSRDGLARVQVAFEDPPPYDAVYLG